MIAFWEAFSAMKYDCLDMVIVLVTKIDRVDPGCESPSQSYQDIEIGIRKVFKEDAGIEDVIFAHPETRNSDLSNAICNLVKDMPLRQLEYNDIEMRDHFGIKQKCCANNDISRLKRKESCTPTEYIEPQKFTKLEKPLNFERQAEELTTRTTTQQPWNDSHQKMIVKGHTSEQLDHHISTGVQIGCHSANATNHEEKNTNDTSVQENITCWLAFVAQIHEALAMISVLILEAAAIFSAHFRR